VRAAFLIIDQPSRPYWGGSGDHEEEGGLNTGKDCHMIVDLVCVIGWQDASGTSVKIGVAKFPNASNIASSY
jgi:hypothetical protein